MVLFESLLGLLIVAVLLLQVSGVWELLTLPCSWMRRSQRWQREE